jgi:hypothetical protein
MRVKSIATHVLAAGLYLGSLNLAACAHAHRCGGCKGEMGADMKCGEGKCSKECTGGVDAKLKDGKDDKGGSSSCGQGGCNNK